VVGAPKCGTTSIYEHLRGHPEIFMPQIKEPNFFAEDLEIRSYPEIDSLEEYLALFEDGASAAIRGEASQFYLYSRSAASRIKHFNPAARIVILLREPVSMMRSLHSQYLSTADEDVSDFGAAIALEEERRAGRSLPVNTMFPRCMAYLDVATFSLQVERYFEFFERDAVRVILLDDLRQDTPGVYRNLVEFLGVTRAFEPDFTPRNVGGDLGPLDPGLDATLRAHFAPEIDRLEALIGRDLSAWKTATD
jgi:hypothetical protein